MRNEVLQLWDRVTRTNEEMKKCLAFQEGFEHMRGIMESEGLKERGVIVKDCLRVLHNTVNGSGQLPPSISLPSFDSEALPPVTP